MERLGANREHDNPNDRFAVAVVRSDDPSLTVGHLPRKLSNGLWHFLAHGGKIECEVAGNRRHSLLLQGGLEIPCWITLTGKKLVAKAASIIDKKNLSS